jgi:hypothetical protein
MRLPSSLLPRGCGNPMCRLAYMKEAATDVDVQLCQWLVINTSSMSGSITERRADTTRTSRANLTQSLFLFEQTLPSSPDCQRIGDYK